MKRNLSYNPSDSLDNPFASVFYLMAKPAGASCNLRCEYCYYLEKGPTEKRVRQLMSDETLEEYIRQYIEACTLPEVIFTWHGGEAMMRPLAFYEKAMALQRRYSGGKVVMNCLQTNGTLLNEAWCRMLRANGWLVGVSIDGPREFHDEYRHAATGRPTHESVMRGIRMLQRYGVEWNAMAVVNDYNAEHPEEFYDFFKSIGCRYIQFTPIVERRRADGRLATLGEAGGVTEHSVSPGQWGSFLCRLFDRWVKNDVGRVFVQIFDATLARWTGQQPGVCSMSETCGHAAVLDWNGDVYSCDHFVFPQFYLGNIHRESLISMINSPRQIEFSKMKRGALPGQCKACRYSRICNGECPKNRFAVTSDGEPGLNYLCGGYRKFYDHTAKYFDFMAAELAAGRAPANVMELFKK